MNIIRTVCVCVCVIAIPFSVTTIIHISVMRKCRSLTSRLYCYSSVWVMLVTHSQKERERESVRERETEIERERERETDVFPLPVSLSCLFSLIQFSVFLKALFFSACCVSPTLSHDQFVHILVANSYDLTRTI